MKRSWIFLLLIIATSTSCSWPFSGNQTISRRWEQLRTLWHDDYEEIAASEGFYGPLEEDFIALQESDLNPRFADAVTPQAKSPPGTPGSGIPSLVHFQRGGEGAFTLFQHIHFNTDDHIVRSSQDLQQIDKIVEYMKSHPDVHVAIDGHCDERASLSYNLSLGMRRANHVRNLIIKKGGNPNHLHAVSFGKEQPIDLRHNADAWSKNRRCEFRIWEKS